MPVLRTPSSLGPRSLEVLQFKAPVGHQPYRDGIEPIGTRLEIAPCNPRAGDHGNRSTLFSGNGLQGMAKRRTGTPFYLHKRNEPILFDHEIDLLTEEANVTVEHSPTSLIQESFGQRFEAASAAYGVQEWRLAPRNGGDMPNEGDMPKEVIAPEVGARSGSLLEG